MDLRRRAATESLASSELRHGLETTGASTRAPSFDSTQHYDHYPYDVGVDGGEVYIRAGTALGSFLSRVNGGIALDIGCGPGNTLPIIAGRAGYVFGIDLSSTAVKMAQHRCRGLRAGVIRGSALRLPFPNSSVDVAVALGSLHHTGDARSGIAEMSRVLASGGAAFVSLYGAGSYYAWLYRSVGRLARWSSGRPLRDMVINRFLLLPLFAVYFWAGRTVVHRSVSPPSQRHVLNYFADQLLNPIVSFHRESEIRQWANDADLEVVSLTSSHARALLNVELRKRERRS